MGVKKPHSFAVPDPMPDQNRVLICRAKTEVITSPLIKLSVDNKRSWDSSVV
jgi:hypothetical protein